MIEYCNFDGFEVGTQFAARRMPTKKLFTIA